MTTACLLLIAVIEAIVISVLCEEICERGRRITSLTSQVGWWKKGFFDQLDMMPVPGKVIRFPCIKLVDEVQPANDDGSSNVLKFTRENTPNEDD